MAFFSKPQKNEEQNTPPRNPNNTVMIRLLAIGYVAYLCVNMIKLYIAGGSDAPSLTALVLGIVVLGGGSVFMAIITYREWKRNKATYDAYMAELRAEAEAKRAAEEAQAALDAAEDEYYDSLETEEVEEEEPEEE